MPETFPPDVTNRIIHQNECNVSENEFQKLALILNNFLDKNVKKSKNTDELCQFIRTSLQYNKVG